MNYTVHVLRRPFFFKTPHGRTYRGVFTIVDDEIRVLRVRGPGQPSLEPDELGRRNVIGPVESVPPDR